MFRELRRDVRVFAHEPIQCGTGLHDLQVVNSLNNKLNFFYYSSDYLCEVVIKT
ncbi:hypothetical protein XSR1_90052 [Xenorhabdus szentirmaii DSM 16338]|uniref:Uncharacterized protein n=1 Tax=Xenorhabdus szentirmaii DSM 16338 TaxID=1427518 RepID=W1J4P6_9GAMM|nr:hypothetical protein XSR1_90052 [Xenorhabdus szentirmaii DSM 16338]